MVSFLPTTNNKVKRTTQTLLTKGRRNNNARIRIILIVLFVFGVVASNLFSTWESASNLKTTFKFNLDGGLILAGKIENKSASNLSGRVNGDGDNDGESENTEDGLVESADAVPAFTPCRFDIEDQLGPLQEEWIKRQVPLLQGLVTDFKDGVHRVLFVTKKVNQNYKFWASGTPKWKCNSKEPARISSRDAHRHVLIVECPVVYDYSEEKEDYIVQSLSNLTATHSNGENITFPTEKLYKCQEQIRKYERPYLNSSSSPSPPSSSSDSDSDNSTFLSSSASSSESESRRNATTNITIGACTSVKGDATRSLILQWVEYHRLIGIDHFWIYLNEPRSNYLLQNNSIANSNKTRIEIMDTNDTTLPIRSYITYVPFDYPGEGFVQQQLIQDECIYRGRVFGVDWMALHDVDEYFHITLNQKSSSEEVSVISNNTNRGEPEPPTLLDLIESIVGNKNERIAGLSFKNWFYGRGRNQKRSGLMLDYTSRAVRHTQSGREKMIVRPKMVDYFSVHMITTYANSGTVTRFLDPFKEGYHNHYKLADKGIHENQGKPEDNDPSLKKLYREKLLPAAPPVAQPAGKIDDDKNDNDVVHNHVCIGGGWYGRHFNRIITVAHGLHELQRLNQNGVSGSGGDDNDDGSSSSSAVLWLTPEGMKWYLEWFRPSPMVKVWDTTIARDRMTGQLRLGPTTTDPGIKCANSDTTLKAWSSFFHSYLATVRIPDKQQNKALLLEQRTATVSTFDLMRSDHMEEARRQLSLYKQGNKGRQHGIVYDGGDNTKIVTVHARWLEGNCPRWENFCGQQEPVNSTTKNLWYEACFYTEETVRAKLPPDLQNNHTAIVVIGDGQRKDLEKTFFHRDTNPYPVQSAMAVLSDYYFGNPQSSMGIVIAYWRWGSNKKKTYPESCYGPLLWELDEGKHAAEEANPNYGTSRI